MPNSIKLAEKFDSPILNIALDTIKIGKQALVFVNTKSSAEKTAEDISKKIRAGNGAETGALKALADEALNTLSRATKQCERLALCLKKGTAFHHAGLTGNQRSLVEEGFRKGIVKIICCTPTLAYGMDLPAYRAIIKDLKRYTAQGLAWIPVLDYMQMSGRAGRPNYDSVGQSIAIAQTESEKEKIRQKYLNGAPEEIYSKLAVEPVLRAHVLSLIATNFASTKKQLFAFFDRTFYAYQFKELSRLHAIILKVIDMLDEWGFIVRSSDYFSSASELEDERFKATLMGKKIAEIYIDPLTANFIITCMRNASDKKITYFSFLQMITHTLEIRPLLKVSAGEYDKIQEAMLRLSSLLLEEEPSMYDPEYDDFLNSVKTALMLGHWTDEYDEEFLLEEYNIRPGEIRAKLETADWLLYSTEEICKIMHYQPLVKEIVKLRLRLKYGVKEELLPLVRLESIGRARARILFRNRIRDVKDIRNIDLQSLSQILGEKTALSLKKQIGEEQFHVPENKRKGQISLMDW